MSKVMKYGGGFLLLCVAVSIANTPSPGDDSLSRTAATTNTRAPVAKCEPVFLTAAGLREEMEKNEARLVHAWKKAECATVVGKVLSIDSGFDDRPFISIGTGKKYEFSGIVNCQPRVPEKAFSLTKGQQVEFTGKTGGEIVGTLILKDCEWGG
jgi:hypothetical protein